MDFKKILKIGANVGAGMINIPPIFAQEATQPILPANTSNKIVSAISVVEKMTTDVEAMKGLSGPEKLAAAALLSKDAVLMSSALTGAKVVDQERFDRGVTKITDGWNDVIKSVEKK